MRPNPLCVSQAELRKAQDAQEAAAAAAIATAARQAERALEFKAKHLKQRADEALRLQRSSMRHEHASATQAAEREASRLSVELQRAEERTRREVERAVRACEGAHARELAAARRAHAAEVVALGASLREAERDAAAATERTWCSGFGSRGCSGVIYRNVIAIITWLK